MMCPTPHFTVEQVKQRQGNNLKKLLFSKCNQFNDNTVVSIEFFERLKQLESDFHSYPTVHPHTPYII